MKSANSNEMPRRQAAALVKTQHACALGGAGIMLTSIRLSKHVIMLCPISVKVSLFGGQSSVARCACGSCMLKYGAQAY